MAVISIPSLNLHWLPSIIANPNLNFSPAQLPTAISRVPLGYQPVSPTPDITSVSPGGAAIPKVPTQATGININRVVSLAPRLKPQESAHFESEVPGGSEKSTVAIRRNNISNLETATLSEENRLLLPAVEEAQVVPAVTSEVGTIIASREAMEDARNDYVKEIDEIISPKGVIFNITIQTVILSAFVFIALLAWFEVIRTWYDQTFDPTLGLRNVDQIFVRFWYAVFITALIIILIYILHRWSKS